MNSPSRYEPVPLQFQRLSPPEQQRRSREFLAAMAARRTVRFFSSEPVDPELIANAVRTAGTAPSGANQQPWTFVVVSDPEVKARLRAGAEAEEREFYQSGPPEWHAALAPLGTDAVKAHITDAPFVIVVFAQTYGYAPDSTPGATGDTPRGRIKHYYVRESVGIASGLLIASLTLAGLATLTHTPSPMAFLNDILGRPDNERAELLIPVGYPAKDAVVPQHALQKKPLSEILVSIGAPIEDSPGAPNL